MPVLTATWIEWSMLAFVGIVGFHAAYMVWFTLLRQCKVDEVVPFILLMPVVGILTASLVLGESISAGPGRRRRRHSGRSRHRLGLWNCRKERRPGAGPGLVIDLSCRNTQWPLDSFS